MEWVRLLAGYRKLVVEASRDHGKSWMFSFAYPLWCIQKIRDRKEAIAIALISYSEGQAQVNLDRIRKAVEENPWLKWLYPKGNKLSYTWEKGHLDFSNGCTVDAFGWTSSIRGGHYHLMIVDDPCKDEGAMSLSVEQQAKNFYRMMVPACRKTGQLVMTGNPVDKHDFLEGMESNKKFHLARFPAHDKDNIPLWSDQYSFKDLLEIKAGMPYDVFQREYMLMRVSAGDVEFKPEWITYYNPEDLQGRNLYKIMTIDPSLPGGDALAAVVTGTDASEKTYVLDSFAYHGDLEAGVDEICDMIERNEPDLLGMETFAFQKMYKIWLERRLSERKLNYTVEETGKDTRKSKVVRIKAMQPKVSRRKLLFRKEDMELIDELVSWNPNNRVNKDDLIDALAWQVPLWQAPYGSETVKEIVAGSFDEAVEEVLSSKQSMFTKLFSDFMWHE